MIGPTVGFDIWWEEHYEEVLDIGLDYEQIEDLKEVLQISYELGYEEGQNESRRRN